MKGLINMKKILIATMFACFAIPAFATCAISGESCAFSIEPPTSIKSKYLPNRVQDMRKPDAFRPQYVKPYYDEMINTETGSASNVNNNNNPNCQFGVCLPDTNQPQK